MVWYKNWKIISKTRLEDFDGKGAAEIKCSQQIANICDMKKSHSDAS